MVTMATNKLELNNAAKVLQMVLLTAKVHKNKFNRNENEWQFETGSNVSTSECEFVINSATKKLLINETRIEPWNE